MTLEELAVRAENLEKQLTALASRKYGERAEQALSETTRVETKHDQAIDEVDEEIADALLLIADIMKGE